MKKRDRKKTTVFDANPLWYKDAVIYELHVRAFSDSDQDGVGDFRGLTGKLDYLQDLGVNALWLLPFYPSPLRDDGYDISDYTSIHPSYGTMRDFRRFLQEAHRRGLRVITELVLNHTSDQHPWFQRARRANPGSKWRNFYVWSDKPDRYSDTRIIFQDFEASNWTWDPVAKAYYWHRFYSHQPDLNYDNPQLEKAVFRAIDFWFGLGVDGLRLDAVPYLFEREGTNCENLPETHAFLKKLRAYVDARYEDRLLLAEANQWPEDAVAYFGDGDACHMAFHFPLMPRMFMALHMEDRFPILDILEQTPGIPDACQWAIFLRNHDELTLEMVTDEERDYMYRVYAQDSQMRINLGIRRRLAPLLGNHRKRIELLNSLLFSMPGTPVIYYGDEIGMGDNIYVGDRNGVRTPMQWSPDRNAGFSGANPQKLYLPVIIDPEYHYEAVNVEAQQANPRSLLWWMKRLIAMRKRYSALGQGAIRFLHPENRKILAFLRTLGEENILVVANLSRFVQYVELDLSDFKERVPVELFGKTEFPPVGEAPYFLSLGPHSIYWFAMEPQPALEAGVEARAQPCPTPLLSVSGRWERVLSGKTAGKIEDALPAYLGGRRWFGGKARRVKSARIQEVIPLSNARQAVYLLLVNVGYTERNDETYTIPVTYASGKRAEELLLENPRAALVRIALRDRGEEGILYDALYDERCRDALLEAILSRRRRKGSTGELVGKAMSGWNRGGDGGGRPESALLKGEQSNSSVAYGDRFILKLFRRLDPGVNPDLEIGRFLTTRGFLHTPPVAGYLEYHRTREDPMTVAVLQNFVPNEGDAWEYTLDHLEHYFEHALAELNRASRPEVPEGSWVDLAGQEPPGFVFETIGPYVESARLLGERTAEMHRVLAGETDDPAFSPEPFTKLYQRSLYQSMRSLVGWVFPLLSSRRKELPETAQGLAGPILAEERQLRSRFRSFADRKIRASRIRCHGDYHLGQVLFTGKDFVVLDFEGEPARPLSERRIKRCPVRDVAGMLRSFHYAAYGSLFALEERGLTLEEGDGPEFWARFWNGWVSTIFLSAYLRAAAPGGFLPESQEELRALLEFYLLEKAIYELGYELNNRPDWVRIPLQGIHDLLQGQSFRGRC